MLFPYKYVPHQMEKMQTFIDFVFHEVWCKAPGSGPFKLDLFDGNADLKEVMSNFYYGDTQGGDFFYGRVQGIYEHFAVLTPAQIDQFKHWYLANNDIEKACANNPALHIARYADIKPIYQQLSEQLATFFKGLYSPQLLDLAVLRQKIGEIDDHYQRFMQTNTTGKCPFCGIGDVKGVHHTKREAYDHYLPKGLYPFNSINFRNLAPACHECNSTYKLTKDPLSSATGRRKAFYPYTNTSYSINIKIDLKKPDVDKLTHDDIEIEYGPATLNEEIETWKDVYGIEERYKAKLMDGDGKAWLVEVLDEWKWSEESAGKEGRSPDEFLRDLKRHATKSPFTGANFLKKAFLDGCDRAGLFT
ncbi:MAG: hypothetical protein Q7S46_10395 [Gallionella sp.]|nr:hypothetical protein [Gallionella sp.]